MSIYPPDMKPPQPIRRNEKASFYGKRDFVYAGLILFFALLALISQYKLKKTKTDFKLYVEETREFNKKQLHSAVGMAEISLKLIRSNNKTYLGLIEVVRISVRHNKSQMTEKAMENILAIVGAFEAEKKAAIQQTIVFENQLEQEIKELNELKERSTQ